MTRKRTILFGGSFDPIHIGHSMMAQYVSQLPEGGEVWLMPGRINPLKAGFPPASPEHRVEMCRRTAEKCRNVSVCGIELELPEPSYTIDTLRHLSAMYPDREFILLIGTDNWLCFDRWKDHESILRQHRILLYPRPGYDIDRASLHEGVELLDEAPQALISSTFIREGFAKGMDMNFFVSDSVLQYINEQGLYTDTEPISRQ